jgi:recombination protein RecA
MPRAKAKTPAAAGQPTAAQGLVDELCAAHGDGAVQLLTGGARKGVPVVSTGSVGLDEALGIGGLPYGRIVEVYGPESSGKTTMCLHAVAQAMKADSACLCAFVDAEHALDVAYAAALGVDLDRLAVSQPDYGEQALQIVETLVRSNKVRIIVVDSVAALTPKAEIDGEIGDSHIGLQARLMSQALRMLTGIVHRSNVLVLFVNQLRMKIGVMFGNPETTPGGNALKFYSSVRLDVRSKGKLKDGETIVGGRTRVKVVKNKLAPPFREAEFDVIYGKGISQAGEVLDMACERHVVTMKGHHFYWGERALGHGRAAVRSNLEQDPELLDALASAVRQAGADASTSEEET